MQLIIIYELLSWKNNKNRKPLILNGARQVGKTYALETFAKDNFDNTVYLNMEIEVDFFEIFLTEIFRQKGSFSIWN